MYRRADIAIFSDMSPNADAFTMMMMMCATGFFDLCFSICMWLLLAVNIYNEILLNEVSSRCIPQRFFKILTYKCEFGPQRSRLVAVHMFPGALNMCKNITSIILVRISPY